MNPAISGMVPYTPAPRDSMFISLDANESPFDLPRTVRKNFLGKIKNLVFNRYPDGPSTELRRAVSKKSGVPADRIVAGNGSDELIGCLIDAVVPHGGTMVVPDPTFVMYERLAKIRGANIVKIPLDRNFDLSREFLSPKLLRHTALWFFAYPNNPTANCFSKNILMEILRKARGTVVIDEAYVDFSGRTFLPQIFRHPNLVILRTFSKALGIALGRVGLAFAHPKIANALNVVRLPYNLSGIGQMLALTTLEADREIKKNVRVVLSERQKILRRLSRMSSAHRNPPIGPACPTDSNFVLVRATHPKKVFEFFKSRGILLKVFKEPRLREYIRITVGRPAEMRRFNRILDELEKS